MEDNNIVPWSVLGGEAGSANPQGEVDFIDQDDFWVCTDEFSLKKGEQRAINILPWALEDKFNPDLENPTKQKMLRFGNLEPRIEGDKGPAFAEYRIVSHLPQNIVANLAHVSLPGDMAADYVAVRFGIFGSILGMAGAALESIGGPLVTGAIEAVGSVVKKIPIIGDIAGGLLEGISGGGESDPPSVTPQPAPVTPAPPVSKQVSGTLELPRFYDFIKMFTDDETTIDVVGKVLVELVDIIGSESVPIRFLTRVGDRSSFSRSVFDRVVLPSSKIEEYVLLTPSECGRLLEQAALVKTDRATTLATNILVSLQTYKGESLIKVLITDEPVPITRSYNEIWQNLNTLPMVSE